MISTSHDLYEARVPSGPGRFMKFLGARFTDYRAGKRTGWRMSWGEIHTDRFGLALSLIDWGQDSDHGDWSLHFHFMWLNVYLSLPFIKGTKFPFDEMMRTYGFAFDPCSNNRIFTDIRLSWGRHGKTIYMPWVRVHKRRSIFTQRGWVTMAPRDYQEPADTIKISHPYKYTLRSGVYQLVQATIYVEEREWRQWWLQWCPLFADISRDINISFSAEVGERAGSFKGGCTGCSYVMRPGESAVSTLRRMEYERKF